MFSPRKKTAGPSTTRLFRLAKQLLRSGMTSLSQMSLPAEGNTGARPQKSSDKNYLTTPSRGELAVA
jgi:hypothetical protein